jgi:hypothetical protein
VYGRIARTYWTGSQQFTLHTLHTLKPAISPHWRVHSLLSDAAILFLIRLHNNVILFLGLTQRCAHVWLHRLPLLILLAAASRPYHRSPSPLPPTRVVDTIQRHALQCIHLSYTFQRLKCPLQMCMMRSLEQTWYVALVCVRHVSFPSDLTVRSVVSAPPGACNPCKMFLSGAHFLINHPI